MAFTPAFEFVDGQMFVTKVEYTTQFGTYSVGHCFAAGPARDCGIIVPTEVEFEDREPGPMRGARFKLSLWDAAMLMRPHSQE